MGLQTVIGRALAHLEKNKHKSITITIKVKESLLFWYAKGWQRIYYLKNWLFIANLKYGGRVGLLFLTALIVTSSAFIPTLQTHFEPYFSELGRLDSIRSLFLTLGGALIGATAIAFSLIMFAMQVNVERMPHGLFRKFSSDVKLLGSFAATFSLAVSITGLSLIPDKSWVAGAIVATAWCSMLTVLLFVLAYRRALGLISPTKQLNLVVADAKKNFNVWDKAVKRTTPIFRQNAITEEGDEGVRNKYDMYRITYFQLYPHWTVPAEQAITYCITFSKRYSEQGDHEVSRVALDGIVAINALYIKTKGKTFFSNNYLTDNPLASDSFLIKTLEHLRQNVQVGISRQDEQFIELNLKCLLQLTQLYISVEYGDTHQIKSHAHLVSGYLTSAVESIFQHDMEDVLIEGLILIGNAARLIVMHDKPEFTATISEKIALIACSGTINKNHYPVTQVAVKQLASITFDLLRSKSREVRYVIREIRDDVTFIAELYLKIPDSPLTSIHRASLSPYYSGTSNDTLMSWLTKLANDLLNADPKNETAQQIIGNIAEWADGLYRTEKQLLLLAIENRSQLTFDLVHWIVHITKLLLAVSCANVCGEDYRYKIRRSAIFLIHVFSWIPDNEDTIKYIETYRIADNIFESAVDAHNRGCNKEALEIRSLLLSWTYKTGKYQTGWASLEKSCCGLACLNLILNLSDETLFTDIDKYLSKESAPSFDIRSRTAFDLHEEAEKYRSEYGFDNIDTAMTRVDQARLREILHGVADHLCPEINYTSSP